jgi:arylsulfatase A-like enzyme
MKVRFTHFVVGLGLITTLAVMAHAIMRPTARPTAAHPNILFIILDDVGIDQLLAFNPLAATPPRTPNLDAIIAHGVRFTNFTTMPECSPSRVCFFTGRYPFRTGVNSAITPADLPNGQINPYEIATPRVLSTVGYKNALIGKYHLGGPQNNPAGYTDPRVLGWDYYNGILYGAPFPIDNSLGGQYMKDKTTYPCGFPTGDQRGVCWFQRKNGQIYCDDNNGAGYTGQECVTLGGIPALDVNGNFAPTVKDAAKVPDFTLFNAYYVWPRIVLEGSVVQSDFARQYMATAQTDAALGWIRRQALGKGGGSPWMCTVAYNTIHAPYQQPPTSLYPPGFVWPKEIPEDSTKEAAQRVMSNLMVEATDKEIGRLLVSAGLASRGPAGELVYHPETTNTMVVIVGDNGTYYPSVKYPYDPSRSKGTAYQTGIQTPLIVAGPLVRQPGRAVDAMVNCVDLFQLFGEIAGVDVRSVVPAAHVLDCQPVLPYLTDPHQAGIRQLNYTEAGSGVKPSTEHLYPCVLTVQSNKLCTDKIFNSASLCSQEGGDYFGPPNSPQYDTCCDVKATGGDYADMNIIPDHVWAIRSQKYKLIKFDRASCDTGGDYEFYDLTPTLTNPDGVDRERDNLLANDNPDNPQHLTPEQLANYNALKQALPALLATEAACPGDGNLDKVVNQADIDGVNANWGQPSVFDFNNDGVTDQKDLAIAQAHFGDVCTAP